MRHFYKYHGTGNDFIILDNRDETIHLSTSQITHLCHRNFGIGADGLMLLEKSTHTHFKMRYFNSDGKEGSMCGNGGRCLIAFAKKLNIIDSEAKFEAIDGLHHATITENGVRLKMNDVNGIEQIDEDFFLNTGSPHYVKYVSNLNTIDVFAEGRTIRYNNRFSEKGTNVNFIEKIGDTLHIRTYERGVENETLSCGTGTVAAAIICTLGTSNEHKEVHFQTKGGPLKVSFIKNNEVQFNQVWLEGPAQFVFEGQVELLA
jgi:diaminopimelate epimerase